MTVDSWNVNRETALVEMLTEGECMLRNSRVQNVLCHNGKAYPCGFSHGAVEMRLTNVRLLR